VSINNGVGAVGVDGSATVTPTVTSTYTLIATGAGGTTSSSITVTVVPTAPPALPTVDSFSATPAVITAGESATLNWNTSNADSVSINGGASQAADGSITISPISTTIYMLTATGNGGTVTSTLTITVNPAPPGPPIVDGFSATPTPIVAGGTAILNWATTDADVVSIDNGVGVVAVDGSSTVSPSVTTTYTLTATGSAGTTSSTVTVTVDTSAPPQATVAITGPTLINRGNNVSYTVTLTNTGSSVLTAAQLAFTVTPGNLLKNVSPGSTVNIGNLSPGTSVTQIWSARADKEGSGAITIGGSSGGIGLATATHNLTVIK
jgi:hypothetical protein